jgi:hypothetical protein
MARSGSGYNNAHHPRDPQRPRRHLPRRSHRGVGSPRSERDRPKRTNPREEPFAVAVHHMPTRVIANVYTQTYDGQHAEYHHRTLSRCLP